MRRVVVVAFVLMASAAAALACSTFSSDAEPVADGGDADSAPLPTEAAADAPIADAGPAFCRGVDAQFCWSFDEGLTPLLGPRLVASDLVPTLTDASQSAPSAMLAAIQGVGAAGVSLDPDPNISQLRCEVDVFFQEIDSKANDAVTILQLDFVGSFFNAPRVSAKKQDEATLRLTLHSPNDMGDLGNVPIGKWVHLVLASEVSDGGPWLTRGSAAGATELTVDGGEREAGVDFAKVFFGLGTLANVTWRVRYDNLVCTWH